MPSDATAAASRPSEASAEAQLRLQAAALEAVADPVILTGPGGEILWVNAAFTRQNGWRSDEILGQTPRVLRSGKTAAALYEALWQTILAGRSWNGEVVNRRKDGSEYTASLTVAPVLGASGRPEAFVATHRDISAQRRFEEELRRSEASVRSMIERLPEAVTIHRGGRFVYVNQTTLEFLGYAREEILGRPVLDLVHPDDRPLVVERMKAGLPRGALEERFLRADGSVVTAEVVAIPIDFEGVPAVLAVARDVSERKGLHARMMQLDRAIAVGTLAAGVAHEINNPLAYVAANLEYIEKAIHELPEGALSGGAGRVGELREVVGEAREGAERIRRIVKDLKVFSRVEAEIREVVELAPVLETAIKLCWNEIRHRAHLVKRFEPTPRVAGNAGRLGQLFVNLLVNAAQAIPEGQAAGNAISIATSTDAEGRAVIEIHDTGEGIRPELLPRIFDPFFTTKPVGQGTGLGLSICREIVGALDGTITVESERGKGSTFRISLPPADAASPGHPDPTERPPVAESPAGWPSRRARILLVDDEPMVGRALARLLAGHETVVATSAGEAFQRVERGERFDAILCDLMMPDMSGMELHARLETRAPELASRMIFLSGGAFTPAAAEFLGRVPNERVDKPVGRVELENSLRVVLGGRKAGD